MNNIEKIDILPLPIYKFKCDLDLVKKVYNEVLQLDEKKYVGTASGFQIYPDYFHNELFDFFDSCLLEIKKKYLKENVALPIVDCWVNRYPPLENAKEHYHSNSLISGNFYLSTHPDEGSTRFTKIHPWFSVATEDNINYYNIFDVFTNPYKDYHQIFPEAGTLILFPSNLLHYTKPCTKSKTIKHTIAFNAFPSGEISTHTTKKLKLTPYSIREKFGQEK